jgi:hypothetical protein
MTVDDIIRAVRYSIDEEAVNAASLADASTIDGLAIDDTALMNNIIRNKIGDALRWVCLYAPADQLGGSSSSSGGGSSTSAAIDIIQEDTLTATNNVLTPTETLIRVVRVKGADWHRAILGDSLIKEDSDEYLQLRDENGAAATADRPQAALVNTKQKKVEVWPGNGQFVLTYIKALSASDLSNLDNDQTEVGIPTNVETSFIYYLAYLLCTTYGDARAKSMFDNATLNLGRTEDKQLQ